MDRRNFLTGAVSSVLAAAGIGTGVVADDEPVEHHGGETAAPDACDSCRKLQKFKRDVRTKQVPNTEYERQKLKRIVDPENHSWEDDCLYTQVTPMVNETVHDEQTFDKADVREMDYDISVSSPTPHLIDVTVNIHPPMPLRVIESTVTVSGKHD